MPETMQYTAVLAVVECCACHMRFAMPEEFQQRALEHPRIMFFCPAGHEQHYAVSENTRLKEQLANSQAALGREQRWRQDATARALAAEDQARAAERSASAYRGHATRLRNRAAAGVCPAGCHRHFENLARHMAAKHPGYASEELSGGA